MSDVYFDTNCFSYFSFKSSNRCAHAIDGNYRVINLIFKKYGNLTLCLENYALFLLLLIFTKKIYTYILRHIIHIGEPPGNIIPNYHGTFIHIFMHGYDLNFKYILNRFFYQCCRFICQCIFFLANINSKTVSFLQVEIFLELISLMFPSCRVPQANLLQNFIRFLIRKRQGQKPKLILISFHLYGMIITF